MAKSRVPKDQPSYRHALAAMRQRAETDVREAIRSADRSLPDRVRSRAVPGAYCFSLFDGIISALADQVMDKAEPGQEHVMARIVAEMLQSKVHQLTCAGNA